MYTRLFTNSKKALGTIESTFYLHSFCHHRNNQSKSCSLAHSSEFHPPGGLLVCVRSRKSTFPLSFAASPRARGGIPIIASHLSRLDKIGEVSDLSPNELDLGLVPGLAGGVAPGFPVVLKNP